MGAIHVMRGLRYWLRAFLLSIDTTTPKEQHLSGSLCLLVFLLLSSAKEKEKEQGSCAVTCPRPAGMQPRPQLPWRLPLPSIFSTCFRISAAKFPLISGRPTRIHSLGHNWDSIMDSRLLPKTTKGQHSDAQKQWSRTKSPCPFKLLGLSTNLASVFQN